MSKESNRIIKLWKGASGRYYWVLFSSVDQPLCECVNGYKSKQSVKRAALNLFPDAQVDAVVKDSL